MKSDQSKNSRSSNCKSDNNMAAIRHEQHIYTYEHFPFIFHLGNKIFSPHWHEDIEILYFYEEGKYICEKQERSICPGDISVINSNALHSLSTPGGCEHDCIIIDKKLLTENGVNIADIAFSPVIRDEATRCLFRNVVKEVKMMQSGVKFGEISVKSAVLALVAHLCRFYSVNQNENNTRNDFVKRAVKYIGLHYSEPLTIDDVAEAVSMSKFYFCREFRRETGYTVNRYINSVRCFEAQKLLREGKISVSEVAYRCGYRNLSYFSRAYKSIMGCTPNGSRPDNPDA